MSTFKVTPTHRRTKNTSPSFYVEGRSEKEAVRNAESKSRLLEAPKEWKAIVLEVKSKEKAGRRKKKKSSGRKRILITPNKKAS